MTKDRLTDLARRCRSAADLCVSIRDFDATPISNPELALALKLVEDYFRQQESEALKLANKDNPYFIGKTHSATDPQVRIRVRHLVAGAQKLFGSPHYRTIATITNVGLGLATEDQIAEADVRNWVRA